MREKDEMYANDKMFSLRQKPWHGKGVVVEDAPTAAEAIKLAGLDWRVNKLPIFCSSQQVKNRVGLVREDTNETLGVVTPKYEIAQNAAAFDFIEALIGEELRYETAGSIFNGRKIYITTKWQKRWTVADDDIDLYLLLSNSHTGTDALKVAVTPVRVVCNNTLQMALRSSRRTWAINHYSTMEQKIQEARTTLRLSTSYMDNFVEFGNRAADKLVSPNMTEAIVEELFPGTNGDSKTAKTRRENRINQLERCYNAPDLAAYRGTAWGILNAVADYETHRKQNWQTLMAKTMRGEQRLLNKTISFLSM